MAGVSSAENATFALHLPGLARLATPVKPFQNFLRTDGVSVSLLMKAETSGKTTRKRQRQAELPSFPQPSAPSQRVVGIDPGRRDMIACVSNQGDRPFTVSTKSVVAESGQRAARVHTRKILRACSLREESTSTSCSTLLARLSSLPSRRNDWSAFTRVTLPLLETILSTYEKRALRRVRFASYMRRDQALDEICKRITGGTLQGETTGRKKYSVGQQGTLVAFGAANACSTGFGYAPAPQERLRRRLAKLHGARVFLVDEYRTSQLCCKCSRRLEAVTVRNWRRGEMKRVQPHGLRRCSSCHNEKGAPLYCHRDVNAAWNMLHIFLAEAETGRRPEAFRRPSQLTYSSPRSPERGLGLAVRPPSGEGPSKRAKKVSPPSLLSV